jgi:uncharacterized protein YjbI with pentapeptide repeats
MARIFGEQSFKTNDEEKDKRVIYEFASKQDFDLWQKSDMMQFTPGGIDDAFKRQKLSEKEAKKAEKAGGQVTEFKPFKEIDMKGSYLHIKHPDPKHEKNFGVVIRFDDKKMLDNFLKRNGDYYKDNAKRLKSGDKRQVAATVNGAFLKYQHDKQFDATVKMACKNYNQLDPSRNHLAMVSQKDWSKPEVYSFSTKSFRDHFVQRVNQSEKLPIKAGKLKNFHPIAIDHAAKGKILTGTLNDHFKHMSEYLAMNNASDISKTAVSNKKLVSQPEFDKALSEGKKEFKNLDMRSVNLNGHSLSGMDFSGSTFAGQNLDGIKFDGAKAAGADFKKCSLNGTSFVQTDLKGADFKNSFALSAKVNFKGSNLAEADLKYMKAPGADLESANLVRSNLYKAELKGANLLGVKDQGAQFNHANMEGAKIDGNQHKHKGASFTGVNLKGTSLEQTPLNQVKQQDAGRQM